MEHFFPRIQMETCAQMHTGVKFLEGMQRKTTLKLLGGDTVKLLGEIYPPRFRHPCFEQCWWKRLYFELNVINRLTIRPGLGGTVLDLWPCPGWLVEMSCFFVCEDHLKIRKNMRVAGMKTFLFGDHHENHAKLRLSRFSV